MKTHMKIAALVMAVVLMAFLGFSRSGHVLPLPIELPDDWPRWRGIDWGFESPFCCLWLCKNPDNNRIIV